MKMMVSVAALVAAGIAGTAQADLVAYWNFNVGAASGSQFPQAPLAANQGSGTMTTNWTPSNYLAFTPSGASAHNGMNALNGDPDGNDLGLQNGTVTNNATVANEGRHLQFQINTTGLGDVVFTAAMRATATGMQTVTVQWSLDGTNFTNAGTLGTLNTSAYQLMTFDLSSVNAIENQASAYVRLVFSNPARNSSGNLSSAGNVRIDNVQFNGVVPNPGTLALLGLGAMVGGRRRR